MHRIISNFASLALLLLSCSTLTLLARQKPSLAKAPTCTDLSQVEGPVIEFGQEGGNIRPYSLMINSDGEVTPSGPVSSQINHISPLTIKALVQLATMGEFWKLPEFSGQNSLPDTGAKFVTIHLSCTRKQVTVRGNPTAGSFAEVYSLLSDLTQIRPYQPSDNSILERGGNPSPVSINLSPDKARATNVSWTVQLSAPYCGGYNIGGYVSIRPIAPLSLPKSVPSSSVTFANGPAEVSSIEGTLQVKPAEGRAWTQLCSFQPQPLTIVFSPGAGWVNPAKSGTYYVEVSTGSSSNSVTVPVVVR
jgi:hypothetical protein